MKVEFGEEKEVSVPISTKRRSAGNYRIESWEAQKAQQRRERTRQQWRSFWRTIFGKWKS